MYSMERYANNSEISTTNGRSLASTLDHVHKKSINMFVELIYPSIRRHMELKTYSNVSWFIKHNLHQME